MAAKRSPILGYNHNVRFRGIVFHIQTEDSGIVNPHVFTHLFHGGVIISTRKLVYDPGSNDDAVKSLMQAQHKAVMKDLRKGTFDEKIDSYLAGTPGLVPREQDASAPVEVAAEAPLVEDGSTADGSLDGPSIELMDPLGTADGSLDGPSIELMDPLGAAGGSIDGPPIELIDPLGAADGSVDGPPIELMDPLGATHSPYDDVPLPALDLDDPSSPSIELLPASDELSGPVIELIPAGRASTATGLELDGIPNAAGIDATIPMQILPDIPSPRAPTLEAAAAPPAPRPPIVVEPRPGASTPPPVRVAFTSAEVARAPTEQVSPQLAAAADLDAGGAASARNDVSAAMRAIQVTDEELTAAGLAEVPEVAEVHSPAPPSAPTPPGASPERAGSYHLGRKTGMVEVARPPIPRPSSAPPVRPPARPPATPPPLPRALPSAAARATPTGSRVPTPSRAVPSVPRAPTPRPSPPRPPTPTASAIPRSSNPPGSGPAARGRPPSGGVVVSRPAVIVGGKGAPTSAPAKVRRAREAEGFGGDLISERSLDEVILAYLSEDAADD